MIAVRAPTQLLLGIITAILALSSSVATRINFKNQCVHDIQLWDNVNLVVIPAGGPALVQDVARPSLMWRHGAGDQATLAEFSIPGDGKAWYDISIVAPGSDNCKGFDACRAYTGKTGFNVGLAIVPKSNTNGYNCIAVSCLADRCPDAYQYPSDDWKTHDCPASTEFDIVFCPPGSATSAVSSPASTPSPSASSNAIAILSVASSAYIKANYTYRGQQAGNALGSYDMTWDLKTCQRRRVYLKNRVGPLSEEVSLVFRGPMEIFNIAVYLGSSRPSASSWKRVSWYKRGGVASNLVFMNNKNIDYTGARGPQGFASSDGKAYASQPQPFSGSLAEAANPELVGGGPGVDTGVEVNIMTSKPCSSNGYDCPGFHGDTWSYHGWGGSKKVFVTQVQMPWGASPNLPAIWILNAQVLWSGQYSSCNCRGWGAAGGCGELDVAEVIETNMRRDKVSTHYYFYDGTVVSPAGGDNFATRPVDGPTVYITVFDSCECAETGGVVKILEITSFDFDQDVLSDAQVQQWISA